MRRAKAAASRERSNRCAGSGGTARHGYRGTVREAPTDGQAQWDSYRIWTEATAIIDVEAASIPELADLMRRYATVDDNTQRALLLDTPPSLRGQADPAYAK